MAVSLTISITQNSQSIANNTSNVTVQVRAKWTGGSYNLTQKSGWLKIDGTTYSFTNSFNDSQTTSGSKTLFTKTVNVSHGSDGTKTLSCSASYTTGVSSGTIAASASKVLTAIARVSTLSANSGTLGTAQTLTITRYDSGFTHKITYKCGSASGTVVSSTTATSVSWTPPVSLASQNTTGTSLSVTFTLTTYTSSGTQVGTSSKTITCKIPDNSTFQPSCSLSLSDSTGYSSTYGSYLKDVSKLYVKVTATAKYSSSIASYKSVVSASGVSGSKTYTSSTFTVTPLSSSGTWTVKTTVTDKRGYSKTVTTTITVADYSAPKISSLAVTRCDCDDSGAFVAENDQGAYVRVKFSATVMPLNNKNSAVYNLQYKKSIEVNYTAIDVSAVSGYSITDAAYTFPADTDSSYDVLLTVTDDFNTATKTTSASTGFTIMHFLANGFGMALGKVSELTNVLDIGFKTRFAGGILHPVLEADTDLNDVRTPNTYVGANTTRYNYQNCPITAGTFTLVVRGAGAEGQAHQILTSCAKANPLRYERLYYGGSWGEWLCMTNFDGTLLATPGLYMTSGHTVTLSESISKQRHGIVLVFSEYIDGATANQSFHCRFVPKMLVSKHSGCAQCIQLSTSNLAYFATKYLYITDTTITGHDNNGLAGTGTCGITYTNKRFVLRYVIGV